MTPANPLTSSTPLAPPASWPWRLLAAAVVLGMAAGLYVGGAQPVAVGLFKPTWDKLAHVLTFALVGAAGGVAGGRRGWVLLLSGLASALLVGAMDEWHQTLLPGRSASWGDLLADALGGLLGAGFVLLVDTWRQGRVRPADRPAHTPAKRRTEKPQPKFH